MCVVWGGFVRRGERPEIVLLPRARRRDLPELRSGDARSFRDRRAFAADRADDPSAAAHGGRTATIATTDATSDRSAEPDAGDARGAHAEQATSNVAVRFGGAIDGPQSGERATCAGALLAPPLAA